MDREDIVALLQEHGAKLIREGNHYVYRLPNGKNFVMAKTPSDVRAEKNNLAILRRELGIERPKKEAPVAAVHEGKPHAAPTPEQPETSMLEASISQAIMGERSRMDFLLDEAAKVEKNIAMLEGLLLFANEQETERTLRSVLGQESSVVVPMAVPKAQVHGVTSRVQVTGDLVLAATQTFDGHFTMTELIERMLGDRADQVDEVEQKRIRSSVVQMVYRALSRGEIKSISAGIGRRPAVYEKVALKTANGG